MKRTKKGAAVKKGKASQPAAVGNHEYLRRTAKIGLPALILVGVGVYIVVGLVFGGLVVNQSGAHTAMLQPKNINRSESEAKQLPDLFYNFPDGGRELFPDYRLVALYGAPGSPILGALGQQSLTASLSRAKKLAEAYQPFMTEHALPAFEIIATVASSSPTENNDYSRETPVSQLSPWVEAAKRAGVYVVLDMQSGRSDFLKQAKEYESLLKEPNVGLALDPEWRLAPNQVPLEQIGTVSIGEINQTADWLAKLVDKYKSPQKLFLLHQFRLDMIEDRQNLDTSHKELAYVIQMDGQGAQAQKTDTWQVITAEPHPDVRFGWKNFYQKDTPMLTPQETMAISPKPWYVSYQ